VIWLPPLPGAVQVTVAVVSPAVADTLAGAAGAVGDPADAPWNTTVAISQMVDALVPALALGVAPDAASA
jgi:hypothetical protein